MSKVLVEKELQKLRADPFWYLDPVKRDRNSELTGFACEDESLAVQAEKDNCDINKILEKYATTGMLPQMIDKNPEFGDFSDVQSYEESLQIVMRAQEQFEALDAHVRNRFDNDPAKFLAFATDKGNLDEMRKMGLAPMPKGEDPLVTEVKGLRSDLKQPKPKGKNDE